MNNFKKMNKNYLKINKDLKKLSQKFLINKKV